MFPPKALPKISCMNPGDRRRRRSSPSKPSPTTGRHSARRSQSDSRTRQRRLSNPDMMHSGILPHHTKWAKAFENLEYVVIDELHYYAASTAATWAISSDAQTHLRVTTGSSPQVHLLLGNHCQSSRTGSSVDRRAVRVGPTKMVLHQARSTSSSTNPPSLIASSHPPQLPP